MFTFVGGVSQQSRKTHILISIIIIYIKYIVFNPFLFDALAPLARAMSRAIRFHLLQRPFVRAQLEQNAQCVRGTWRCNTTDNANYTATISVELRLIDGIRDLATYFYNRDANFFKNLEQIPDVDTIFFLLLLEIKFNNNKKKYL